MDIETAPNVAYVWGLFKQNIAISQLVDSGYVLCWAAKWLDDPEVEFSSIPQDGKEIMLHKIYDLLDEADVVVHYNGKKFDIPTLNKEFVLIGLDPPSPYKQIDLLRTVRAQFRFASNKLAYVLKALGLQEKVKTTGFELWIDCMKNDPEAWEQMEEYNRGDVTGLEQLYLRLLPWIPNHPNRGVYDDLIDSCPTCGGHDLQKRGFSFTTAGKYQRYQCQHCSTWSRGKTNLAVKGTTAQDKI